VFRSRNLLAVLPSSCAQILAWATADVSRFAAIEVYPAATLVAHRIRSIGLQKAHQTEERREIVVALRTKLKISESVTDLAPWSKRRHDLKK